MDTQDEIQKIFQESIQVKERTCRENLGLIKDAVEEITKAINNGGKVLLFGNGGSASDAQHIAAELIGRYKKERPAIPAIALTTDTSILTALSNDYNFDIVYARQIEGLGSEKDIAIGLSTSGNSNNVIEGIKQAKKMGMKTISLTGGKGGELAKLTDISLIVSSDNTARIQESHICIAHVICELVENQIHP